MGVVLTLQPAEGDNTGSIQRAVDEVSSRPVGPGGHRGAVQLDAGVYEVAGTIRLAVSGVVLRGVGDGEDPALSTILRATGSASKQRNVITVGGEKGWDRERPGTRTSITQDVPLGESTLTLRSGKLLRPGDAVLVRHSCTRRWLSSIEGGGTGKDDSWGVDEVPISYLRHVAAVSADRVTLDAPLYATMDLSLSEVELYAWDDSTLTREVGVEDLRVDVVARDDEDEDHAVNAIVLRNVVDAWVRGCTATRFAKAGVMTTGAWQVTVEGCRALRPAARVEGGRRYNFDAEAFSQLVLFTDCHASQGRHSFVVNGGSSASGVVFHRTTATGSLASSEGHRRWSQGILYDNHMERKPDTDRTILLGSRGDYGTGHGWSAVNSVAWRTDVGDTELIVQRPPTAQNYAIACRGAVSGDGPFEAETGYVEGTGRRHILPTSLFEAQRDALPA